MIARSAFLPIGLLLALPAAAQERGKPPTVAAPSVPFKVQAEIAGEIRRQVKPYLSLPESAAAQSIRTKVEVQLSRDGGLVGESKVIEQFGVNESNRGSAELHKTRVIEAIKHAAPFQNLPPEYYDIWKGFQVVFDKRLTKS